LSLSQTLPGDSSVVSLAIVPVDFIGVLGVDVVKTVVVNLSVLDTSSRERTPVKSNLSVSLSSSRSLHGRSSGLHEGNTGVEGRDGGPSIAVVSGGSHSDLFSRSDSEGGQGSHGNGAGVDVNIATAEVVERSTLSLSVSRAHLHVVTSDRGTTVSGTSPGDLNGTLNSAYSHSRSRRLGSESDFESLRSGSSTGACALNVESVESAVSNGNRG
jgi:hypothetical protein